jgi:glycine betaine/proline transport system substrate-binding protein
MTASLPWRRWGGRALGLAGLALAVLAMSYVVQVGGRGADVGNGPVAAGAAGPDGAPVEARPLRIGWTAWADAEVVTLLATRLIEDHLGHEVDRVMADIGIQYQGVAQGNLDLMLMAWLPTTHRQYWRRVRNRVVDLGPIYSGRLGWVVPDRIPPADLDSIEDLRRPAIAARLGDRIQGIDPGSGLMQASERALQVYGLDDLRLVPASGAAMTAVLERAMRDPDRWVVVTAWQPHWIFARHRLRFLADPRGVLGHTEQIHAVARQAFGRDYPRVVELLSRFHLGDEELDALLLQARDTSPAAAVEAFLADHPRRVEYWVSGRLPEGG